MESKRANTSANRGDHHHNSTLLTTSHESMHEADISTPSGSRSAGGRFPGLSPGTVPGGKKEGWGRIATEMVTEDVEGTGGVAKGPGDVGRGFGFGIGKWG